MGGIDENRGIGIIDRLQVTFGEFAKYVIEHEQRLELIFQDLDKNRDGERGYGRSTGVR